MRACLAFLEAEEDADVQVLLADALLGNFAVPAVDVAWRLLAEVDETAMTPDDFDLRERLVAVATIMGALRFPAYEAMVRRFAPRRIAAVQPPFFVVRR